MYIETDLKVTGDTTLSKLASVGFLKTSGTGLVSTVATIASTDLPMAVDTDEETGTSTTKLVSPGVQHYHPSSAKVWIKCGVSGDRIKYFNVASVEDGGTGIAIVHFTTSFTSANYVGIYTPMSSVTLMGGSQFLTQAADSINLRCYSSAHGMADPESYHLVCYGEQ